MESAFGIDHGPEEIAKFGLGSVGGMVGGAARLGAKKTGQLANKVPANKFGAGPAKAGLIGAGRGLKKVSGFAAQRPNLTGGLGVGAAATGVGGAGGMFANRRRQ